MEEEIPFFTKSKEKFETSTIEAWGMLRRHLLALRNLSARDMPDRKYKKLWDYEQYLIRTLKYLEEIPCLLIECDDPLATPLESFISCEPVNTKKPCQTMETDEETVGTYAYSMRQSLLRASSSGE